MFYLIQVRCNVLKLLYELSFLFLHHLLLQTEQPCVVQVWHVKLSLSILLMLSSSLFFLFIASQSVEVFTRTSSSFKVVNVSKVSSTKLTVGILYYNISGLLQPELYTTFLGSIMFFNSIPKAQ